MADVAAAENRLHIYCAPGHKGAPGNETADEIAKSAIHLTT